ncbi:MAG TPA: radical SAM protein [Polyangium sp.]|nr:radical SAM protein [Polyangium sp.]
MTSRPEDLVSLPAALQHTRRYALDGALLCFHRETGLSALCKGPETAHLRMRAPRVVQFAITNACNLACTFCSRDEQAKSSWTAHEAFEILRQLDNAGTMEVAFGGGEPLVFKGMVGLVHRLYQETQLGIGLTTNGTRLDDATAKSLAPVVGQIRLSVYDNVEHLPIIERLVRHRVRFGVNWLVTPPRVPHVPEFVLELAAAGCRDILLLSYNGRDPALHLDEQQTKELERQVQLLHRAMGARTALKLDICWGSRLDGVPRLFANSSCPAGREFIVLTSDKRIAPCSFHHESFPIQSFEDIARVWRDETRVLSSAARDPGCARAEDHGLFALRRRLTLLDEGAD